MPFEPGQSGNPGGREPETAMSREVKRLAKEKSPEAIERLVFWMKSDNPKASVSAANSILDRAFGKPKQAIVGGDDEDNPIRMAGVELHIVDHRTKTAG